MILQILYPQSLHRSFSMGTESEVLTAVQFAVSQGPNHLDECSAVNIRFLLMIFEEGAVCGFLWHGDIHRA